MTIYIQYLTFISITYQSKQGDSKCKTKIQAEEEKSVNMLNEGIEPIKDRFNEYLIHSEEGNLCSYSSLKNPSSFTSAHLPVAN